MFLKSVTKDFQLFPLITQSYCRFRCAVFGLPGILLAYIIYYQLILWYLHLLLLLIVNITIELTRKRVCRNNLILRSDMFRRIDVIYDLTVCGKLLLVKHT